MPGSAGYLSYLQLVQFQGGPPELSVPQSWQYAELLKSGVLPVLPKIKLIGHFLYRLGGVCMSLYPT